MPPAQLLQCHRVQIHSPSSDTPCGFSWCLQIRQRALRELGGAGGRMLQARWVPQPRHGLEQSRCLGALPLPAWVPCLPTQNPPGEPEEPPPNPVTGWASKGVTRAPCTASLSHPHGGHGDSSAQAPLPSQGGKPGGPQYPPACSKPCCHFPTCPQHPGAPLYLPACGRPIHPAASALQLEKNPSFPSGATWGRWSSLPEPGQS